MASAEGGHTAEKDACQHEHGHYVGNMWNCLDCGLSYSGHPRPLPPEVGDRG